MEKLYTIFPQELVSFVFVVVFSLLIGLSQRKLSLHSEGENTHFGTDRTFTFIGILGYLLYMLDPKEMRLFIAGGFALTVLFGLNYYQRMVSHHVFGSTSIVIGVITYCLAYREHSAFLVLYYSNCCGIASHRNEKQLCTDSSENAER